MFIKSVPGKLILRNHLVLFRPENDEMNFSECKNSSVCSKTAENDSFCHFGGIFMVKLKKAKMEFFSYFYSLAFVKESKIFELMGN